MLYASFSVQVVAKGVINPVAMEKIFVKGCMALIFFPQVQWK